MDLRRSFGHPQKEKKKTKNCRNPQGLGQFFVWRGHNELQKVTNEAGAAAADWRRVLVTNLIDGKNSTLKEPEILGLKSHFSDWNQHLAGNGATEATLATSQGGYTEN